MPTLHRWLAAAMLLLALPVAGQEKSAVDEIMKYRQMLEEGNPADLMELKGQELWITPRGPKRATFEQCDMGVGPGKLDGAYAQLPRYFADTGKVQDAESRLVTCMTVLQGFTFEEATADWYKPNSDIEALVTYVATQSKGYRIDTPVKHPAEAEMLAVGTEIFWRRAGPLDFSCATCHSLDERRIRLQDLPNFQVSASAQSSMVTWPAYRVSQSAVWTMERRLIDCIRQMRWPEPEFLSDAIVAIQSYLQNQARGGEMRGPGIKR